MYSRNELIIVLIMNFILLIKKCWLIVEGVTWGDKQKALTVLSGLQ
ncbi:hypothetical protein SAMN05660816_00699 [Niastella yeongjuensis]|nr:hypothetical protein SAMN05660816_00699 [Niastella yeongjuensis]